MSATDHGHLSGGTSYHIDHLIVGNATTVRLSNPGDTRRTMRGRIALKIFSIALALLVLLVIVAIFSTRNIARVRNEVEAVVQSFAPLAFMASAVQIHQLEQELQMERAIGALTQGKAFAQTPEQAIEAIRSEGRRVDDQMAAAEHLVDLGLQQSTRPADREEFAQLKAQLRSISHEHQGYEDRALAAIEMLRSGNVTSFDAIRGLLQKEEAELDGELQELRKQLEAYSQTSSMEAASHQRQILWLNIGITAVAIVSGLLFAAIITSGLTKPILRLLQGTQDVEHGDLEVRVPVTTRDEIGVLTASFNGMVEQLQAKERMKQTFGKYVDPRVVERLLAANSGAEPAGERQRVSVMFTDIRGFSAIAENLTPSVLVQVINRYFSLMGEPIVKYGGIVDKFIGDAVMAFWAPPFVSEDEHATHACLAALEQVAQLDTLQRELPDLVGFRKGVPDIGVRIGLATGDAVVGSIGSERSKGFTVMGDTVNIASRLEGVGRTYGTSILLSEETRQRAGATIEAREIDSIRVAGKHDPLRIFELLAPAGGLDAATIQLRDTFERGLAAYRARDIAGARLHFTECLRIRPSDQPSQVFLKRLELLATHIPGPEWDGVWTFTK